VYYLLSVADAIKAIKNLKLIKTEIIEFRSNPNDNL